MCRRGVEVSAEQPIDHAHQDLLVLLPQEGVGEGIRRCFAVAQALTDDPPVAVHVHGGQELGQPAGGAAISKEGGREATAKWRCLVVIVDEEQVYVVDFHLNIHARCPFSRLYHHVWPIYQDVNSHL